MDSQSPDFTSSSRPGVTQAPNGVRLFDGDGNSIIPSDGPALHCFDLEQWRGFSLMYYNLPDWIIHEAGLILLLDEEFTVSDEVMALLVWELQRGGAVEFRAKGGGSWSVETAVRRLLGGGHA